MTADQTHKFPNDPILVKLLIAARHTSSSETIIHDVVGFEKTYPELLSDILRTRDLLRARLPASAFTERGILHEDNPYVAILSRSGYEFLVAFFAIRAIGGVCMPFASGILPEEALFFLSQAKSACMLAGKERLEKAAKICAVVGEQGISEHFALIPITSDTKPQETVHIGIDDTLQINPDDPGVVLFSSGTTGQPKGVILPRRCFVHSQLAEPGSATINYRAAHWIGGAITLLDPVLTGKKLYALGEKATAETLLEAFQNHRITHATFAPTLLQQMKELLTGQSGELSNENRRKWSGYFKCLSTLRCTAGMVDQSTLQFWTDLTGLQFENLYGATELGGVVTKATSNIGGSIGKPLPGIEVKLSEGNYGEICVKSPRLLIRYLGDEKLTRAAFDKEGYFKTGDLAELKDGEYIFAGRANTDYVSYGLFRFSTLRVENSLMDLPYVAEACVVGVPHQEVRELCGAVVRLINGVTRIEQITLSRIRSDLGGSLALFMMPLVLRIIKDGEELPRTVSGKPIKRQILKNYFGTTDWFPAGDLSPGVEYCGCTMPTIDEAEAKPWDFGGLQPAD